MRLGLLLATVLAMAGQAASALPDRYDFERPSERFELPRGLNEISGLAITADGRLFAHADEAAIVYELDRATGSVVKRFSLGGATVRGDFEGIAIVGDRFFLVTSQGLLYEFREVADGARAAFSVVDTGLGARCEVEGLDYDAVDSALWFACKVSAGGRDVLIVHRLAVGSVEALEPIRVARAQLREQGLDEDFEPSAVAVDPSGTILLSSASSETLIEVDRAGRLLSGVQLSRGRHPQPEGLAFGPDHTLYVADERNGQAPHLTAYARR